MTDPFDLVSVWIDYYLENGDIENAMQMKWFRLARHQTDLRCRRLINRGEKCESVTATSANGN